METDLEDCIKRRNEMKTVDVIFVSDDLVGSTIISNKEYERLIKQKSKTDIDKGSTPKIEESGNNLDNKTTKRKALQTHDELTNKRSKYIDDVELALAALENDDVEKLTLNKPSTLFDKDDVSAKMICDLENKIHTPKTPKSMDTNNSKTKISLGKSGKNLSLIPDVTQTPYSLRKKFIKDIKEIQKILENSDDDFSPSDSDNSYELSDDSVNETSNNIKESGRHSNSAKSFFESYYDLKNNTKPLSSTNSLKKLKNPKLTQEKLDELVKNFQITPIHKNCIKMLFTETLHLFKKWDFILNQNYNLLLYGAGSKREVITKFVERFFDFHPVIIVNGFFPNIAGKEIIDKICSVLKIEVDSTDIIGKIEKRIRNYNIKIYLAINNIDGMMLRNNKVQSLLSQLSKLDQIHIIASIDHINAPLIWNKSTSSEFNWVWYDSTTFLSYTEETVYEGNIMLQNSGKGTLSSLRNVFNSLTKNTRGIFMVILKKQLESENKKSGVSFRELYQECRRELLISSDVGLRAQLKEFIDHLVLKQKRNADGEEYFMIMMENNILKQFLEEQEVS